MWEEVEQVVGRCCCPSAAALEWGGRLQRLFFLNEGHDLSRFLVADLGILRYPSYTVRRTRPVWVSRAALLAYEAALSHAEALDAALEVGAAQDKPSISCAACIIEIHACGLPVGAQQRTPCRMLCVTWAALSSSYGCLVISGSCNNGSRHVKFLDLLKRAESPVLPYVLSICVTVSACAYSNVRGHVFFAQSGNNSLAVAALQPAWAALEANLHKDPRGCRRGGSAQRDETATECPFLLRFTAAWVYVAMASAGVSLYEKQKQYEEACDIIRKLLGGHT